MFEEMEILNKNLQKCRVSKRRITHTWTPLNPAPLLGTPSVRCLPRRYLRQHGGQSLRMQRRIPNRI